MHPSRFAAAARRLALTLTCAMAAMVPAHAAPVSYQGTFAHDNDLVVFNLNITSMLGGTIDARTFSHSGGANAAGAVIPAGGFAPVLVLFDSLGFEVFRDVGTSHTCPAGFCWDAFFNFGVNSAGSYKLVLSQDDNLPNGNFADGYSRDSDPDYTAGNTPGGVRFVRFDGVQRTGNWALDVNVSNTPVTAGVPEPASLALVLSALSVLTLVRRRKTV